MKKTKSLVAAASVLAAATLAGCGGSSGGGSGDGATGMQPGSLNAQVTHSYPRPRVRTQGQPYQPWRVPVTTPYIITFDRSVYGLGDQVQQVLRRPVEPDELWSEGILDADYRYADRGRTLIIVPREKLKPFTEYTARWSPHDALTTRFARVFETDGLYEGTIEETTVERHGGYGFRALHSIPYVNTGSSPENQAYPLYPLGSYIMTFTQPLDEDSVIYGPAPDGAFRFEKLNESNQPVEFVEARNIAVAGKTIVFTPETPFEDGVAYRVTFNLEGDDPALTSIHGEALLGHVSASFRTQFKAERVAIDDERWPLSGVVTFNGGRSNITDTPVNAAPGAPDLAFAGHMGMEFDYIPGNAGWDEARSPFRLMLDTLGAQSTEDVAEYILDGALPESAQAEGYRLTILSEPIGTIWWYSDDPWNTRGSDIVELDMIVGLVNPDGEVIEKDFVQFQGHVSGSYKDDSFTLNPVGILKPAVLMQDDEPGNGVLHLSMTFNQLPDPNN